MATHPGTADDGQVLRSPRPRALLALVATASVLSLAAPSIAAADVPGFSAGLDPTYGVDGVATVPPAAAEGSQFTIASTFDGQGRALLDLIGPHRSIVRLTSSGAMDETFGVHGRVDPPPGFAFLRLATSAHGVLVMGDYHDPATQGAPSVVAALVLHEDGSPDLRYGPQGMVLVASAGDTNDGLEDGALSDDGTLTILNGATDASWRVWRFHADGTPDLAFGVAGVAGVGPVAGWTTRWQDLAVDAAGGVLVTLDRTTGTGQSDQELSFVSRLTPAGALDPHFGQGGSALVPGTLLALAIDPTDGSILLGGGNGRAVVWRFTAAGAFDRRFYGQQVLPDGSGDRIAWGIAPLGAGRVAVLTDGLTGPQATVLAADGSRDAAFGNGGVVSSTHRLGEVGGIGAGSDGRVLIATHSASDETVDDNSVAAYPVSLPNVRPTVTTATGRPGSLTVSWSPPPAPPFGAAVAYHLMALDGSVVASQQIVSADVTTASLSGLQDGTTYHVVVLPYTTVGPGYASAPIDGTPSSSGPAITVAGAVQGLAASAGRSFATVTWNPPASDGGAPIVGYSVIAVRHDTGALAGWRNVRADLRTAAVPGLATGQAYDLYVLAVTASGFGTATAPVAVVPSSSAPLPQAPTASWVSVVHGTSSETVSWGPPVERGEALTKWNVIVLQNGAMRAWQVLGPEQRQTTVTLDPSGGQADVYVVAQSISGYGPLGDSVFAYP